MAPAKGMAELQVADLCAGFQAGGTIMKARQTGNRRGGGAVTGPIAPSVERPDDGWAWHDFPPLILRLNATATPHRYSSVHK